MIRFVFGILFLVVALVAFLAARAGRRNAARKKEAGRNSTDSEDMAFVGRLVGWASVGLAILLVGWSCIRVVPANHVGIPTQFGSIGAPMDSGIKFVAPWTDVNTFSTRMQESSMLGATDEGDKAKDDSIEVRGSDGYLMRVDVTARYFVQPEAASRLFRLVGSEDGIRERLVRPEVREAVRVAFAAYTAEEGYTSEREAIRALINDDLASRLEKYDLRLDSVAVRNVSPDTTLAKAISDRAAAREKALQANIEQGRLLTEAETRKKVAETDATAKIIAANAEAEANDIVAASLTPEVLQAKQIEALRDANTVYLPLGSSVIVAGTQS